MHTNHGTEGRGCGVRKLARPVPGGAPGAPAKEAPPTGTTSTAEPETPASGSSK